MSFLAELDDADARLGGKARSLARLAAHGLATPSGFALTGDLFRSLCPNMPDFDQLDQAALAKLDELRAVLMQAPWPAGFRDELHARLAAIGAPRFSVRSSFASEDLPGQLAAGVYESYGNVPMPEVEKSIRQVLCSALAPGAVAYAMAHGQPPARDPVAVLVHAFLPGQAEGSAAFAPGRMEKPWVTLRRGQLPAEAAASLEQTLTALAAARGPLEIEWVFADGQVVYLQARPFEAPAPAVPWTGFDQVAGGAAARAAWRWDVTHNPLPLSPAQVGLVELVDSKCSVGIRQRVLGGYLFYARDEGHLPPPIAVESAAEFFALLRLEVESRLARLGQPPDLESALAVFVFAYEPIFGVLQPALRAAHDGLRAFLETHAPAALALLPTLRSGVPSMASERRERAAKIPSAGRQSDSDRAESLANYLELFGDEAPIWDVCAATYAEAPAALLPDSLRHSSEIAPPDWQAASAQVLAMLPPDQHAAWLQLLDLARAAVALGEADDWLYARTQAAVRRALLGLGERLRLAARLTEAADVFFVPFDLVRKAALGSQLSVDFADFGAAEGRAAWQRARGLPPPLPDALDARAVRGSGTGGRAIGRLVWHRPGQPASAADTVLAATTLLPTELPLISAVAIVTETGGSLDHVAAQARERGIPAVVGAHGASALLADGDLVLVDGDAGLVVRLGAALV